MKIKITYQPPLDGVSAVLRHDTTKPEGQRTTLALAGGDGRDATPLGDLLGCSSLLKPEAGQTSQFAPTEALELWANDVPGLAGWFTVHQQEPGVVVSFELPIAKVEVEK